MIARRRGNPAVALGHFDRALGHAPGLLSIQLHRARSLVELQSAAEEAIDADRARACRGQAVEALNAIPPDDGAYQEVQELLRSLVRPK